MMVVNHEESASEGLLSGGATPSYSQSHSSGRYPVREYDYSEDYGVHVEYLPVQVITLAVHKSVVMSVERSAGGLV